MRTWSEWDTKLALGDAVRRPAEWRCATADEAVAHARSIGGPVVAKASGVAHKSDLGLVRVGLDPEQVAAEFPRLAGAGDGTVIVAEQLMDFELELIVGAQRDPVFGPFAAVGIGGIAAELFDDATFVLLPTDVEELGRAVRGLSGARLLEGIRGRPALDTAELHGILAALGDLLHRHPEVDEVECNPVVVRHGVPFVLDALAVEGA